MGQLFRTVEQLEQAKPFRVENEVKTIRKGKDSGDLELENSRFKTRIRKSENVRVRTTSSRNHNSIKSPRPR